MASRSPGPATMRFMKLTSAFWGVGASQTWPSGGGPEPQVLSSSAPAGGWKTTTSPTPGSLKRAPIRLTSTRWPICSVGTIDSDGIRYGLTRKAWMPSARPSATATIRTSSSSELDAELVFDATRLGVVGGGFGRDGRRVVRGGRGRGLGVRELGLAVARRGRRIVEEARLDDLLRAGVAPLPHPRALADAAAQVVQLGAPHVAACGDLDALNLRRVQRERALHADAEGLLAHGEGLAHAR